MVKIKNTLAALALALTFAPAARGQEDAPPPTRAEVIERSMEAVAQEARGAMSFSELWRNGGMLMWFLAAMSVFGMTVVFYLLWILRDRQIAPDTLTVSLLASVQNGDLASARALCAEHPCQLGAVMLAAFDHLQDGGGHAEAVALREAVEAEGARQAQRLQGQSQLLLDIATIAPMLGLLGTVLGMLQAFGAIALDVASAKPVVLAAGVSKAIITTVFGLAIAIPAMCFYAYFRRRAAAKTAVLEAAAARVTTVLAGRFHA
ncbi:MAG: MotA/TolQ/ExbB proton channel family protein [Kiritimatiellaeota bacterium]|nr:MotA/TolQ/ExbB proton channel family protein [Kiritimatiellota bacterium]